jgi:tetratricopeptide (TPR) repeat protein
MRPALILAAMVATGTLAAGAAGPAWANKSAEAEAAFAAGRDEEAIRLFGEAIAESAADPGAQALAYFGRGEVQALNRRTEAAIADFTAALGLDQDDASRAATLYSRAEVYGRAQRNAEALADYTESLKRAPGLVGVHYARGSIYRRMDMKAEALADFDAELKINPTSYRALSARADLLGLPPPKTGARGFEDRLSSAQTSSK